MEALHLILNMKGMKEMKFNKENIILDINANNQEDVLRMISEKAFELGFTSNATNLKKDFLEREKEFSTGFGNGVAIPHAKTSDVNEPSILFVRLNNTVDWNSMDDQPVNLIIAIVVPENAAKEHLDTLAKLSRKIIHSNFINQLQTKDADQIADLIKETIA